MGGGALLPHLLMRPSQWEGAALASLMLQQRVSLSKSHLVPHQLRSCLGKEDGVFEEG